MAIEQLSEDGLENALRAERAVIYKHSSRCWLSSRTLAQVRSFAAEHPGVPLYMVDVIMQRALSRSVEAELGVMHKSPQAIVLHRGAPTWEASHLAVTADALAEAVAEVARGEGMSANADE